MSNIKILKWQRKKNVFFLIYFVQITVVQKILQILTLKIFFCFVFQQQQKNILIVVYFLESPCCFVRVVCFFSLVL